jgi:hypothetical protein
MGDQRPPALRRGTGKAIGKYSEQNPTENGDQSQNCDGHAGSGIKPIEQQDPNDHRGHRRPK